MADQIRWWVLGSSLLMIGLSIGLCGLWMRRLEHRWAPAPERGDTFEDIIATIRWDDDAPENG